MNKQITNFDIFKYFLYIGLTGFGGPLAIIQYFYRDLVQTRKWMTEEEFRNYFGYAQIAPGPLAFQVALYFSYFKKGFFAAVLAAIGLFLPSYIIVLIFSLFYASFRDITVIKWMLYGIGPLVIGIIFHSGLNLSKNVFKGEYIQYIIFFLSIIVSIFFKVYIIYLIFAAAFSSLVFFIVRDKIIKKNVISFFPLIIFFFTNISAQFHNSIFALVNSVKDGLRGKITELAVVFLKAGALTYGSGFVIVGVLRQEVVEKLSWLTPAEFLDGIAFGQITPGPVVITSTFIGYLISGVPGSVVATIGVFLPTFIFVMIISQIINRIKDNFYLQSLLKGANAASIGAILSTGYFLSVDAITDIPGIIILAASIALLFFTKIKPYYLIIVAAVSGILIKYYI